MCFSQSGLAAWLITIFSLSFCYSNNFMVKDLDEMLLHRLSHVLEGMRAIK